MSPIRLTAAALLATAACSPDPAPLPTTATVEPTPTPTVTAPRFDPVKVEAAQKELKSWRAIIDLVYQEDQEVEWLIGVRDDGTLRIYYAESICMTLKEMGVVDKDTDVRIVDYIKYMRSGGDSRSASLAHLDCQNFQNMGI